MINAIIVFSIWPGKSAVIRGIRQAVSAPVSESGFVLGIRSTATDLGVLRRWLRVGPAGAAAARTQLEGPSAKWGVHILHIKF